MGDVTRETLAGHAAALAAACRRLHRRGLLAGAEGNVSVRLADGSVLVTASGVDKSVMLDTQVVRLHADGTRHHRQLLAARDDGGGAGDNMLRASSEVGMHLACYAARADVYAVVHAHPPVATGFATAGQCLPMDVLPELPVVVGPIALVPYGRPGTPALASAMQPSLAHNDVFLLANHGVTTLGRSLTDALLRMESVEQSARIVAVARVLGGEQRLPIGETEALAALYRGGEFAVEQPATRPT